MLLKSNRINKNDWKVPLRPFLKIYTTCHTFLLVEVSLNLSFRTPKEGLIKIGSIVYSCSSSFRLTLFFTVLLLILQMMFRHGDNFLIKYFVSGKVPL